ncbi:MAG: hypothetical protein WEB52_12735 [Dehalococcoidia bacterium]
MTALRILLVPSMLLAAVFAWVAMNPGSATVANPDATATPRPAPTATPVPDLPAGVWGALTYRTGHELVGVRFPQVIEEQRYAPPSTPVDDLSSASGWWVQLGGDETCTVTLHDDANPGPSTGGVAYAKEFQWCMSPEWSPARARFAFSATTLDNRTQLIVIDGASPSVRVLIDADATTSISTLAWHGDRLLVSGTFAGRAGLRWLSLDGALTPVDGVPGAAMYFYPSPDRSRFLFTQAAADGWQLWMLDATTNAVTNLGNMGSDPANASTPEQLAPEAAGKGGPMYLAWSPDGTQVAFGGGFDPPYIMTTVNIDTGASVVTEFPSGYPGEIRWTADGTNIAVSTYDIERTHHETWVVDPITGAGRHLMDGCVIVWSPDGRFLAIHGEDVAGITIIDVNTAERGQLTHRADDAPIEWTE